MAFYPAILTSHLIGNITDQYIYIWCSCSAAHLSSHDVHLITSDHFNQPIRSSLGRKDVTEAGGTYVTDHALITTKIGHCNSTGLLSLCEKDKREMGLCSKPLNAIGNAFYLPTPSCYFQAHFVVKWTEFPSTCFIKRFVRTVRGTSPCDQLCKLISAGTSPRVPSCVSTFRYTILNLFQNFTCRIKFVEWLIQIRLNLNKRALILAFLEILVFLVFRADTRLIGPDGGWMRCE